jgi:hypothetical protein
MLTFSLAFYSSSKLRPATDFSPAAGFSFFDRPHYWKKGHQTSGGLSLYFGVEDTASSLEKLSS